MGENIFIKILFVVFIGVIVYLIYNFYYLQNLNKNTKCNLNQLDIDDMVIIKRTNEYSNLIDDIIDKKKFIFSKNELDVLKNPQQIFYLSNNDKNVINRSNIPIDQINISNISDVVYLNCKNNLEKNMFDFDKDNTNNETSNETKNNTNNKTNENFENLSDYQNISKMLNDDIKKLIGPNCYNIGVLKNNMPLIKNYLKNYYQDLYGNKIDAELEDYFVGYYTMINNNDNVGIPVNTLIGNSNFIIPDQYIYNSPLTNAYNIDWNRIINPIGYSQ